MSHHNVTRPADPSVTGIVLAGGQGSRMGGKDKGWVQFREKPMIEHVVERLAPQVNELVISANRHLAEYRNLGFTVVSDDLQSQPPDDRYQGPIAGMLAGLEITTTDFAVIVPCDAPLLSQNLVTTLLQHSHGQQLVLFRDKTRLQPLFGLYHRSLVQALRQYFESGGRKLMAWCESQNPEIIELKDDSTGFTNINTPEELQALETDQRA